MMLCELTAENPVKQCLSALPVLVKCESLRIFCESWAGPLKLKRNEGVLEIAFGTWFPLPSTCT